MNFTNYCFKRAGETVGIDGICAALRTIKLFRFLAIVTTVSSIIGTLSSPAIAGGLAADAKLLGGLTDRQCLQKVDRVIANEQRSSNNLIEIVRGSYSRKLIYDDGSVDFSCTPNLVNITVYFNNAGNNRARADLGNFLREF